MDYSCSCRISSRSRRYRRRSCRTSHQTVSDGTSISSNGFLRFRVDSTQSEVALVSDTTQLLSYQCYAVNIAVLKSV